MVMRAEGSTSNSLQGEIASLALLNVNQGGGDQMPAALQ